MIKLTQFANIILIYIFMDWVPIFSIDWVLCQLHSGNLNIDWNLIWANCLNLATPGYECYELFYDLFLESELKSNDVQNTDNTQKAQKSLQAFEKGKVRLG